MNNLLKLLNGQRGFTLVELLITIAIGGAMAGVLVPSIFQMVRHTRTNTIQVEAITRVESVVPWLSRDINKGYDTDLTDGVPATSMTISWTDWTDWSNGTYALPADFVDHSVTYIYSSVNRAVTRNYDSQGADTIARNIDDCDFTLSGSVIKVTVLSQPESEDQPPVERTYNFELYPVEPVDNGIGPLQYEP